MSSHVIYKFRLKTTKSKQKQYKNSSVPYALICGAGGGIRVTSGDPETSRLATSCHRKVSLRHATGISHPEGFPRVFGSTLKQNGSSTPPKMVSLSNHGAGGGVRTPESRSRQIYN